jgi:hypothetical protein
MNAAAAQSRPITKTRFNALRLTPSGPSESIHRPLGLARVNEAHDNPAHDNPAPRRRARPRDRSDADAEILSDETLFVDSKGRPLPAIAIGKMLLCQVAELQRELNESLDETAALRAAADKLRLALAEMKAELAAASAHADEARATAHRLQIDRKGDRGERGPQGLDGAPGPRGERGPRGESGLAAPRISAWEAHPERFEITPVFSTGERGAPINLLSLFQAYHSAVEWVEDADLEQAAADSRAEAERELQRSRWAK